MRDGLGMKSLDTTYKKFSSRGVYGASGRLRICLRLALKVITMRLRDVATFYAAVALTQPDPSDTRGR